LRVGLVGHVDRCLGRAEESALSGRPAERDRVAGGGEFD
jgi:hypothetical protein